MRQLIKAGFLLLALTLVFTTTAIAQSVDREIVLLADISQSMSASEKEIQRKGYAAAFRSASVVHAIEGGDLQSIAVAYVEFASTQTVIVDWVIIRTAEDAAAFADAIETAKYPVTLGIMTALGDAIAFAGEFIRTNGIDATKRVIDVSSDGPSNQGVHPEAVVKVLTDKSLPLWEQYTINGLPVEPDKGVYGYTLGFLVDYYEQYIVAGPSSFLVRGATIENLPDAILHKLTLEIAGNLRRAG